MEGSCKVWGSFFLVLGWAQVKETCSFISTDENLPSPWVVRRVQETCQAPYCMHACACSHTHTARHTHTHNSGTQCPTVRPIQDTSLCWHMTCSGQAFYSSLFSNTLEHPPCHQAPPPLQQCLLLTHFILHLLETQRAPAEDGAAALPAIHLCCLSLSCSAPVWRAGRGGKLGRKESSRTPEHCICPSDHFFQCRLTLLTM